MQQRTHRNIIVILLFAVLALTGCTGRGGREARSIAADSIYTWENIRQYIIEQPEHALALVDTAEMRELADVNQANWMRACIYYNSPKVEDFDKSRDYCLKVLDTNHRYVDEAIRESSDSPSTKAFIDGYRVDHAARLLTDTDEPIALIAEMSGFANRTSFNERFRERYKMTPSEYRRAAKIN